MSDTIQRAQRDGVVVLRLDRPVANVLVPEMRAALMAALADAEKTHDCRAVVIAGAGPEFCSGVDLSEDETGPHAPDVAAVCRAVAACARPVVAALHGAVAGAGLSLALAAQGRVAHVGARLSLPEIALGQMPCAGATQRLPRLVGAQAALEMMLSGHAVRAGEARLRPLFDRLVADEAGLEAAAVDLAARVAAAPPDPARRDPQRGLSDPRGYQRAVAAVRARMGRDEGTAAEIVRAVEAAQLLPLAQGLEFEAVLAAERAQSRAARALCHLRLAERGARALPEMRAATPRAGGTVARVGLAGAVPKAFAERLAATGVAIVAEGPADPADLWIEPVPGAAPEGAARVTLDGGNGFGREGLWLRVCPGAEVAEIGVGPGAVPGDVAALARLLARARMGVVRAGLPQAGPGAGRMLAGALDVAALALVQAGLGPGEVDRGAQALGLGRGPCLGMDHEGLEAAQARLTALAARLGLPPPAPDGPLAARIARGARGRSVGRGFYEHPPEGPRAPRGDGGEGALPGRVDAGGALHAALVNAAERLLASGALARPGDADLVAVGALGMARDRGGPLFAADDRGLLAVLGDMTALAPLSEALWAPQPGIVARVREGQGYFRRSGAAGVASGGLSRA